jgi:hypothetical protein
MISSFELVWQNLTPLGPKEHPINTRIKKQKREIE